MEKTLKSLLVDGALRTMVPIRTYEPKMLLRGKMNSIPPFSKDDQLIDGKVWAAHLQEGRGGHRRSWGWYLAQKDSWTKRRVCATGHGYNRRTRTQLPMRYTAPASRQWCSQVADIWLHTCHMPSLQEGSCQDSQKVWKNTSGKCTPLRGWIVAESACSSAS